MPWVKYPGRPGGGARAPVREGGFAHHGHHLPYSDGVEDLRGWAGHGHQPGYDDVGIKDDAHVAFALPRPLRQFAQG